MPVADGLRQASPWGADEGVGVPARLLGTEALAGDARNADF